MPKHLSLLACTLLLGTMPANAELLQVDLSIYGMD